MRMGFCPLSLGSHILVRRLFKVYPLMRLIRSQATNRTTTELLGSWIMGFRAQSFSWLQTLLISKGGRATWRSLIGETISTKNNLVTKQGESLIPVLASLLVSKNGFISCAFALPLKTCPHAQFTALSEPMWYLCTAKVLS